MPTITKPPVTEALADLDGRLIMPGDADYDAARASFLGGIDMHPTAIIRVGSAADVARVVTYASEAGLPLAVRSGGHSPFSSTEGGMLLDLHDLKGIELDLHGRTVWSSPGTAWRSASGTPGRSASAASRRAAVWAISRASSG
jgi:FAD/FMN-containing dehydrogenase